MRSFFFQEDRKRIPAFTSSEAEKLQKMKDRLPERELRGGSTLKEKRVLTEHLAVANTVIYISIFLACIGLFLMVVLLMLFMETYVFPSDLIQTWPTLNKPAVELVDKIRLAVFIS